MFPVAGDETFCGSFLLVLGPANSPGTFDEVGLCVLAEVVVVIGEGAGIGIWLASEKFM